MIEMKWELCLLRGTVITMPPYLVVACSHLSSLKALPNCKSIQWFFWCQCSVTCGDGIRQRAVTCMDLSRGTPVDKSYCTGAMYVRTEEFCRRPACASWRVGDWTFCSVSCGKVTSVILLHAMQLLCMFPTLKVFPRSVHNFNDIKLIISVLKLPPFKIFLIFILKSSNCQRKLLWEFHCNIYIILIHADDNCGIQRITKYVHYKPEIAVFLKQFSEETSYFIA
jgi:hypothetical protein